MRVALKRLFLVGALAVVLPAQAQFSPSFPAFIQGGSGAVSRPWLDKAREVVSLRDFMAAPDGTTDNTTAFRDAIAALPSSGGVLVIPPAANPYISAGVSITKNVTIWVQGGATVKAKTASFATLFDFSGTTSAAVVGAGLLDGRDGATGSCAWAIRSMNDTNFTVEGVELYRCSQSGVKLIQCARCVVRGVFSHGHGYYGVVMYGTTYSTVQGSRLGGNAYYGIGIVADSKPGSYDVPALYNTFSANTIEGNRRGGINVDNNVRYTTIAGNTIIGGGDADTSFAAGVLLQGGTGSSDATVSGNTIYNVNGVGIRIEQPATVVTGNKVRKSGLHGIYCLSVNDVVIAGNSVMDNSSSATAWVGVPGDGIRINSCARVAVSGNVVGDRRDTPYQGNGINEMGAFGDNNTFMGNRASIGNQIADFSAVNSNSLLLRAFSSGSFTATAGVSSKVVTDARVTANSIILVAPRGTSGGTFIQAHGPVFALPTTPGTSFTAYTGDGANFDGSYSFAYILVEGK